MKYFILYLFGVLAVYLTTRQVQNQEGFKSKLQEIKDNSLLAPQLVDIIFKATIILLILGSWLSVAYFIVKKLTQNDSR